MSANVPTDICFSFSGLIERGGRTGPHRDGWGISFYQDGRGRTIHDPYPGYESQIAALLKQTSIKSEVVISHIRQANVGEVSLVNTHPFSRQLWGTTWTFAHNGQLNDTTGLDPVLYQPIGTTDSERAFCWLLERMAERSPARPHELTDIIEPMQADLDHLRSRGVFNMLMTDSSLLYAYCSTKLCRITRRAPFGVAQLCDAEVCVDFKEVTSDKDVVTVIATSPLTDNESWTAFEPGELCVVTDGEVTALAPNADTAQSA